MHYHKEIGDEIDEAHKRYLELLQEIKGYGNEIYSESDCRVKIIDRILLYALGWGHDDVKTESKSGKGYLDYLFSNGSTPCLLIEAKKVSRSFNFNERKSGNSYQLNGPTFKSEDFQEGFDQAVTYSAYNNTELACVTNGKEWAIFRSLRIGEHTVPSSGKAFLFKSLEDIADNFSLFFDLLSKKKVVDRVYRAIFREAEGRPVSYTDFQEVIRSQKSATLLPAHTDSSSLEDVMNDFFTRITDETNEEMLRECFVESSESKAAEKRLVRMAEELNGRMKNLDTKSGKELRDIVESAKSQDQHRFVLIVGTKGAGKSTFINRFFSKKLNNTLSAICQPIHVNLEKSNGDESNIVSWLQAEILRVSEEHITEKSLTWDEIIGNMFFAEYRRWSEGTMSYLYENDKTQFKIEFGRHIEDIRKNDPDKYISGLLRNFFFGRNKIPCLIFDNADHFSISFQERVYNHAKSLYESSVCIVLMPITDKTSWQLSRQGALQSFENEALLLPSPSPKLVIEKRVEFVLARLRSLQEVKPIKDTFTLSNGMSVSSENMVKFVLTLQEALLNSKWTTTTLSKLANIDIRRMLELTRSLINSPYIDFDSLFSTYVTGSPFKIKPEVIARAIIKGRYDIFFYQSNKYLKNLYHLIPEKSSSPLLAASILQMLRDSQITTGESRVTYVEISSIVEYFEPMGIDRTVTMYCLDELLKNALIFDYDPTCTSSHEATKVEISPAGSQHLQWSYSSDEYIYAAAEVTPINDNVSHKEMSHLYNQGQGDRKAFGGRFCKYLVSQDAIHVRVPHHDSYNGQRALRDKVRRHQQMMENSETKSVLVRKQTKLVYGSGASKVVVGKFYKGEITTTHSFGAFMKLESGVEAFIHISQLSNTHVSKTEDVVSVGDSVKAKCIEIHTKGPRMSIKGVKADMS